MKQFLDSLKQELIDENLDNKVLLDYIDGRIAFMIEEALNDRAYVNITCVQDEIQKFNDR